MLELRPITVGLVRALAAPAALDALDAPHSGTTLRVAPTELLLLCDPEDEASLLEQVRAQLSSADAGAVALADADSFAAWALDGAETDAAFAALSAIPLPTARPAFLQGLVADVPAKVVASEGRLLLLVGSTVSHHLRARVLEACAALEVIEAEPTPLATAREWAA